jgi:FkbM family methyltransferase
MKWNRLLGKFWKKEVLISLDKIELLNYLPTNAVIIEAGAFDGEDTEDFAKCLPNSQIHSFECLPEYYEIAKTRIQNYSNVHLYPLALSDKSELLDFYVSTRHGELSASGSILQPKLHKEVHPEIKFEKKIKVQTTSIDDWSAEYQIEHVDFIWLDLQGAEMKALKGASHTLANVKAIFTEVSLIETYEAVPLYDNLKAFLFSKGFKVEREYLPYQDMGNVFFVKA